MTAQFAAVPLVCSAERVCSLSFPWVLAQLPVPDLLSVTHQCSTSPEEFLEKIMYCTKCATRKTVTLYCSQSCQRADVCQDPFSTHQSDALADIFLSSMSSSGRSTSLTGQHPSLKRLILPLGGPLTPYPAHSKTTALARRFPAAMDESEYQEHEKGLTLWLQARLPSVQQAAYSALRLTQDEKYFDTHFFCVILKASGSSPNLSGVSYTFVHALPLRYTGSPQFSCLARDRLETESKHRESNPGSTATAYSSMLFLDTHLFSGRTLPSATARIPDEDSRLSFQLSSHSTFWSRQDTCITSESDWCLMPIGLRCSMKPAPFPLKTGVPTASCPSRSH